jgi:hypothetical protein
VSSAAAGSALPSYTERSCLRKRRYWSQVDALVMAARCIERRDVGPLAAYRCRNCDGWHLTRHTGDAPPF